MSNDHYDAVILGAGPGGEVALNTLAKAGRRLAIVECELIGGECTNWGCIPTKTLLRPPDLRGQTARAAGARESVLDFAPLAAYRDYMVSDHDDSHRVARYEERGMSVVKAAGRLDGPGRVVTEDGRTLDTDAVVVATGASAVVPPIPGLREAGFWTNREITSLDAIPESVVFIGGGVVSVELSQFLSRFGCKVTIVQGPDRLAEREEPRVGELLTEMLIDDGVEILLGRRAVGVRREGDTRIVELEDGSEARGAAVVVATGRRPRTQGIGLETVGIQPGARGIEIDERCRAGDGVWAIGDVTGLAMFTHVAKYQGRVAAKDILGEPARADYRAVPRVIFTDPEVASVGLTEEDARDAGIDVVSATIDLPTTIARPYTYEQDPRGTLSVIVDQKREVLVGAWAVAPLAGEWIHQAVLAIRAEIPVAILSDTIAQFPTFSEAFGAALRALPIESSLVGHDHRAHMGISEEDEVVAT
jgi:pyruvate/2-oxoglutarate dehydrogenase complex dihydrolipoamide dehydrogenase (E3) component